MKEHIYVIREEGAGWTVSVAGKPIAQPFPGREQAIAAASSAVAKSRARGCYAWIKVLHSEILAGDQLSFARSESSGANSAAIDSQ